MKTKLIWLSAVVFVVFLASCSGSEGGDSAAADSTAVGDSADADTSEAKNKKPAKERSTSIRAARVIQGDLVIPVIAEGAIRSRNTAQVKTEISGRLDRLYVSEGSRVKRGQIIAKLDDREYQLALEEAESKYLEALGKLAADDERLESKTAAADLKTRLEELERLYKEGTITLDEKTQKEVALEVEAVKQGAKRGELVQVRSGLTAAKNARRRAELDLEHTRIRAPFSGVVSNLDLTSGQNLTIGELVCDLVDNVNLEAELAILESDLKGLSTGAMVILEIPALDKEIHGVVDVLSPEIDPATRTCRALVRFENEDGSARAGMFVRGALAGDVIPDVLQVPRDALLTRDGRPVVFRIEDKRSKWVYLTLGRSNDRWVEVTKILQGGPLNEGDQVVVSNHLTLTHDALVKVTKIVEPDRPWVADAGN